MNEAFKKNYTKRLKQYKSVIGTSNDLAKAWTTYELSLLENNYRSVNYEVLYKTLSKIYWKELSLLEDFESFFTKDLHKALAAITNKEAADCIFEIAKMRFEGIYSMGWQRRSFRSKRVGLYIPKMIEVIHEGLHWYSYGITVTQVLEKDERCEAYRQYTGINGYENALALALKKGETEIVEQVTSALLEEDANIKVSHELIRAIIISGNQTVIEALGKLLLAAQLQEGLRQAIVEHIDCGTIESALYFLKLIIDHDLYRFSSVIRAMDTWTGLAFSNEKKKVIEKCMSLAYEVLKNPSTCETYSKSKDVLEVYFALWGLANVEVDQAVAFIENTKDTEEKYVQLLFLYFTEWLNNEKLQYNIGMHYIQSEDLEVLAWASRNLIQRHLRAWEYKDISKLKKEPIYYLPEKAPQRKAQFQLLETAFLKIGNKKRTFTESVFPWVTIELSNHEVARALMSLAKYDLNSELIDWFMTHFKDFQVEDRKAILINLVGTGHSELQKHCIREGLSDRSVDIKEMCLRRLVARKMDVQDIQALISILSMKSSRFKEQVIKQVLAQKSVDIHLIIKQLLEAPEDNKHQAGLEIIQRLSKEEPSFKTRYQAYYDTLEGGTKVSQSTKILLDSLKVDKEGDFNYTPEEGYGLYDIKDPVFQIQARETSEVPEKKPSFLNKLFKSKPVVESKALVKDITDAEFKQVWKGFLKVKEENANYEYEGYLWHTKKQVLLGNDLLPVVDTQNHKTLTLKDYPLADQWKSVLKDFENDPKRLALLLFYKDNTLFYTTNYQSWFKRIMDPFAPSKEMCKTMEQLGKSHYERRYFNLASIYFDEIIDDRLFEYAFHKFKESLYALPVEKWNENYYDVQQNPYSSRGTYRAYESGMITYWRNLAVRCAKSDEAFTQLFQELYNQHRLLGFKAFAQEPVEILIRAYELQLLSDSGFMRILMESRNVAGYLNQLTRKKNQENNFKEGNALVEPLVEKVVSRIIEIESKRGEIKTEVTDLALQINEIKGAKHFMLILRALDKSNFHRGYVYSGNESKGSVLSYLLKQTKPDKEDSPEIIKSLAKSYGISDKRLVEAALYVPAWANTIESAIGWKGLHSGVWFFHAHVSEAFSLDKSTEVARYSPIEPLQFNDGAFDINWFKQAYEQLGEERFQYLYKNAKYICENNIQHRRSQLYVDAVLNRLDKATIKQEIIDKRNQEKLRCFALFPIPPGNSDEALAVYEFIQKFKKESSQYGAQRRSSEGKAVDSALENLAIATGFGELNRMIWALEAKKAEQIASFFEYHSMGKVEVRLGIQEDQSLKIFVCKEGKEQKTLPKEYAKDAYVLELKAIMKDCRAQQSRAKATLEKAMVDQTNFLGYEIQNILTHPILAKIAESLVFKMEKATGFPQIIEKQMVLIDAEGQTLTIDPQASLQVAHPHHLIQENQLVAYQTLCYEQSLIQPFKQIYREYYPITQEELAENSGTKRYAGHQVQPTKTIALLKSKGWTLDYDGLQKVNYKDNIVVHMMALADWFSPSDIEAPTLESVYFSDRKTNEIMTLDHIEPVIFSEAMRDLDLVVSVAHVGGVDPEASHSTVEMRLAIAKQLCPLLKLNNVTFSAYYAKIEGTLGSYTVHLGSGIVHQQAKGMLMILPVQSQARGRIFLPFADSDPKTAEIMSKILLLSQDNKIKDPTILSQIQDAR